MTFNSDEQEAPQLCGVKRPNSYNKWFKKLLVKLFA